VLLSHQVVILSQPKCSHTCLRHSISNLPFLCLIINDNEREKKNEVTLNVNVSYLAIFLLWRPW
jgi:hypothetical protein